MPTHSATTATTDRTLAIQLDQHSTCANKHSTCKNNQ